MPMLPAIELFKTRYAKLFHKQPPINDTLQVLLALLDEYNEQHFYDRNALRRDLDRRCPKRSTAVHEPEYGGRESE